MSVVVWPVSCDIIARHNGLITYRMGQKIDPPCFCQNFIKFSPNSIIFGTRVAKTIELCEVYTSGPPHLIYVNALPCKTQMLQIVA